MSHITPHVSNLHFDPETPYIGDSWRNLCWNLDLRIQTGVTTKKPRKNGGGMPFLRSEIIQQSLDLKGILGGRPFGCPRFFNGKWLAVLVSDFFDGHFRDGCWLH